MPELWSATYLLVLLVYSAKVTSSVRSNNHFTLLRSSSHLIIDMSLSPSRSVDPKDSPAIVVEHEDVEQDERDCISCCATASNPGSPALLPAPYSPGPFGRLASFSKTPQLGWRKRQIPPWKSPLLMILFFIIGLAMSLGHCIFYPKLSGKIVGDSSDQEGNIR